MSTNVSHFLRDKIRGETLKLYSVVKVEEGTEKGQLQKPGVRSTGAGDSSDFPTTKRQFGK